jgi:hypothetical protein
MHLSFTKALGHLTVALGVLSLALSLIKSLQAQQPDAVIHVSEPVPRRQPSGTYNYDKVNRASTSLGGGLSGIGGSSQAGIGGLGGIPRAGIEGMFGFNNGGTSIKFGGGVGGGKIGFSGDYGN